MIPDVYLLPSNVYIDALALITTIQLAFQHLSYLLEVFDCGWPSYIFTEFPLTYDP